MSDLLRRVLTAVVLIPIAIGAVVLGGWWFTLFVVLASCTAQWELYGLCERAGVKPLKVLGVAAGALVILVPAWGGALPLALLAVLALVTAELFRRGDRPLETAAASVFGIFYPAALLAWLVHLRLAAAPAVGEAGAAWLVVTVLVAIWAADTFAFFTGKAIGKRPLFKRVSPNKTIEGTLGGVVGAVATALIFQMTVLPFVPWFHAVVVGLIAGVVGPLGDLTESRFKRAAGVKDSGNLLPGHGGALDRLDAMIFVVPVAAVYLEHVARTF